MSDAAAENLGFNFENLGRRIVEAARLAVAVHLHESVAPQAAGPLSLEFRQRVVIGGAGPYVAARRDLPGESPSEVVTDDDRPGLRRRY